MRRIPLGYATNITYRKSLCTYPISSGSTRTTRLSSTPWLSRSRSTMSLSFALGTRPIIVTNHTLQKLRDRCKSWTPGSIHHPGSGSQAHLFQIMRRSLAVLQPSLFEGWSTTLEEARSIGKRTIVSDIAVHREQDLHTAMYFRPRDALKHWHADSKRSMIRPAQVQIRHGKP